MQNMTKQQYDRYIRQMEPVLEQVKRTEENFYRLEKKFPIQNVIGISSLLLVKHIAHSKQTFRRNSRALIIVYPARSI